MVEEQRARVDEAMVEMVEEVDKAYIRILQGKMFKCAAECCEDKTCSSKTVQSCIRRCGEPLEGAQRLVENELNHFQNRLQRCVMTCNDTIRDKMGPNAKDSEIAKYTKEFDQCAKKCVDTSLDLVPNMMKRIKEELKKEVQ